LHIPPYASGHVDLEGACAAYYPALREEGARSGCQLVDKVLLTAEQLREAAADADKFWDRRLATASEHAMLVGACSGAQLQLSAVLGEDPT
jgi:hypothetical protein